MRDGIYEVEFSDLSAGLQSKGIAIIDCFRFDAVIEGKVFWADYTQNWEVCPQHFSPQDIETS